MVVVGWLVERNRVDMMEKLKTKTQAKNRRDRSTVEALRLQTFLKNELFGPPPPHQNPDEFSSAP